MSLKANRFLSWLVLATILLPAHAWPAGVKLSAIASGGSLASSTDQLVGVRSATTDVLLTVGSSCVENLTSIVVDNGAGGLTLGAGQVTNAMLTSSSMTIAGHSTALGGSVTIACGDLSNSGTACTAVAPANTAATTHNFFTAYTSATGAFTKAQPACADVSDAGTVCTQNTGTSGATVPLLNGGNTASGANVQSGSYAITGTSTPTQGSGTLGLAGTATKPTLGATSEGDIFLTATGGINLIGDGSSFDFDLFNKSGTSVCTVATGTTTLNCVGLQINGTNASTTTGTVTSIATTSPITGGTITATGTIACATCATTTNGGALSGTAPIAVSVAGVISGGGLGTVNGALKGNGSGTITQAACADLSNGGTACAQNTGTSGANVPFLNGANTWSGVQTLSGASGIDAQSTPAISTATFTPNFAAANHFIIGLVHASCPCTLANPTNIVAGQSGVIAITQSATGSDTITTYGSDYIFTNTTAPVLSTTASAIDYLSYYVEDATHIRVAALTATNTGASQTVSYQPGLLSAVNATIGVYNKIVNASTVDNIIGSAVTFTCAVNPVVTMYECGTSTTCAGPTTIGTVTLTAGGTAFVGTVSNSAVTAGDYIGFAMTAGTCASIDLAVAAAIHAN